MKLGFPSGSVLKNLPASASDARDVGSIPGSGKYSQKGNGNPLQYSSLGNPLDRGAWRDAVHGVTESNRLSSLEWAWQACDYIQFSLSVMSNSLWPHRLKHIKLPCPSSTPRAFSNLCPSQWYHPTISSSVVPFSCLQSFQHQSLFQWVSFLHQVAKVLEIQLQHQSFQRIFRTDMGLSVIILGPCFLKLNCGI